MTTRALKVTELNHKCDIFMAGDTPFTQNTFVAVLHCFDPSVASHCLNVELSFQITSLSFCIFAVVKQIASNFGAWHYLAG